MRTRTLPAAGAALILTFAGFGLAGPAAAASSNSANNDGVYTSCSSDVCGVSDSANGNGNGNATGRPDAGTVGKADDKNPKGQLPDADSDGNNGYECDGNSGIAKGNPAHTGCVGLPG